MQKRHFATAASNLDAIRRTINFVLLLAVAFWLTYFALQFVNAGWLAHLWATAQLHRFGDPIVVRFTGFAGISKQYVPLAIAGCIYLAVVIVDRWLERTIRGLWARSPAPAVIPSVKSVAESGVHLDELYSEYRRIEKVLKEAQRKRCTFLSIDVVGSSQMKVDENPIAITASFRAYEDLLRRTFLATRAWKEAWTPDGVMVCFLNREQAVQAAKTILESLQDFNARENKLKTPFHVRCGANEGEVVVFEDSNLEKLVDQVIDVAGHMQRSAIPDTLRLSADLYKVLDDSTGFQPTGETVDALATYEWSPQRVSHA
jgi:class 3 adenylate cyclase